jgi:hypothetical protein
VDRRSFFRLIGRVAAAGVAAKVAPGLLVAQASSECPIGLPGVTGAQGVQGSIGVAYNWTGWNCQPKAIRFPCTRQSAALSSSMLRSPPEEPAR